MDGGCDCHMTYSFMRVEYMSTSGPSWEMVSKHSSKMEPTELRELRAEPTPTEDADLDDVIVMSLCVMSSTQS